MVLTITANCKKGPSRKKKSTKCPPLRVSFVGLQQTGVIGFSQWRFVVERA